MLNLTVILMNIIHIHINITNMQIRIHFYMNIQCTLGNYQY